jgi:hypothetical protein
MVNLYYDIRVGKANGFMEIIVPASFHPSCAIGELGKAQWVSSFSLLNNTVIMPSIMLFPWSAEKCA